MIARMDTHSDPRSLQDTPLEIPALNGTRAVLNGWRADYAHASGLADHSTSGGLYEPAKAVLDFAAALVLLVLSAPVLLACMLLVKLTSRGPALYWQVRLGKDGRLFRICKIRTMVHNCEGRSGACWCMPGDPRVTAVGRLLRATHLDELPQLWNILRGEMSLVGPRPERPEFLPALEKAVPYYRERLRVRPGVTGLAQVQLPPDTDLDSVRRKVVCDLAYTRHLSLWLDVRILALTVLHLFGISCHTLCRRLLPAIVPSDR
jgi:lipopolysaccharide/colanic/teichoic acid biosynthesis glycosyltransferase